MGQVFFFPAWVPTTYYYYLILPDLSPPPARSSLISATTHHTAWCHMLTPSLTPSPIHHGPSGTPSGTIQADRRTLARHPGTLPSFLRHFSFLLIGGSLMPGGTSKMVLGLLLTTLIPSWSLHHTAYHPIPLCCLSRPGVSAHPSSPLLTKSHVGSHHIITSFISLHNPQVHSSIQAGFDQ